MTCPRLWWNRRRYNTSAQIGMPKPRALYLVCTAALYISFSILIFKLVQATDFQNFFGHYEDDTKTDTIEVVSTRRPDQTVNDDDDYLLPINFILANRYTNGTDKEVIQKALKEGHGLEPYVSGTRGWIENGIVYRPFQASTHGHVTRVKSPYTGDFEEHVPFNRDIFFKGLDPNSIPADLSQKKKIIVWPVKTRYHPPMPGLTTLRLCPEFPCVMTHDQRVLNKASAFLFSAQLIGQSKPPRRRADQVFIFHNHEVPNKVPLNPIKSPQWRGVFNWTMTFRMDSDIPGFYGAVRRRPTPLKKNYDVIIANKTRPVAWMVSNCKTASNRRKYADELNKYIPVDIYGGCGTKSCGRHKDDQCMDVFDRQYKFYLGFESSICEEYFTEKIFKYLAYDLIVVGRGSSEYYRHVPTDIFINTEDYPSPKALAERLHFLDNNDEEYKAFLRNKDKYMFILQDYPIVDGTDKKIRYMSFRKEEVSFCYLCYRLWHLDRYAKSIPDVAKWFERGQCKPLAPI